MKDKKPPLAVYTIKRSLSKRVRGWVQRVVSQSQFKTSGYIKPSVPPPPKRKHEKVINEGDLTKNILEIMHSLHEKSPDTIWMREGNETIFEACYFILEDKLGIDEATIQKEFPQYFG